MHTTVAELAELLGGEVEGPGDLVVSGAASVNDAQEGDLVLAEDERFFARALNSQATCVLAKPGIGNDCAGKSVIRVADPAGAFGQVLGLLVDTSDRPPVGVGPGTVIARGARLGEEVAIGPNCFVGSGASIGDRCVLYPGVYIGDDVSVGEGTVIHPHAVVYARCSIGKRVVLHSGAVIGADGFGYRPGRGGLEKLPHVGTVEIGDDVEIGSNSTVDRAKTGATIIGNGTKIDNLVHIAHNVRIGANCVIVALSGVAGSVEIGDNVTLAAQTGVKDHVTIGDGCVVAARAGVIGNLARGKVVSGFPARDHTAEKRIEAARLHLPDMLRRLAAIERELSRLRARDEDYADDNSDH
jgi:UDP-3-O-[3-hydroxymyristoyl] glucosamine N-acyltransferase